MDVVPSLPATEHFRSPPTESSSCQRVRVMAMTPGSAVIRTSSISPTSGFADSTTFLLDRNTTQNSTHYVHIGCFDPALSPGRDVHPVNSPKVFMSGVPMKNTARIEHHVSNALWGQESAECEDSIGMDPNELYPSSPSPSPLPSRQNKASLQKEYRKEEGESFNALRDAIRNLTGEELRTRLEILRKAVDLITSFSGAENHTIAQNNTLTTYEAPTATQAPVPEDIASAHSGSSHSTQSSYWTQAGPSNAAFEAPTAYYDF
ncbi:hypothetical protein V8E55_007639 [Tylopilus felleus]